MKSSTMKVAAAMLAAGVQAASADTIVTVAGQKSGTGIGNSVAVQIVDLDTLDGAPYDHNGSVMIVDAQKGIIAYARPKASIAKTVKPGTVLFKGQPWDSSRTDDAIIRGEAYVFRAGCEAAGYEVRGMYHFAYGFAQFTLEGMAPVRARGSCDITGHDMTSSNSKLTFDGTWD
ncbi:hypothetical protein FY036_20735 [Mesorhizobium microcysteis]|jgi:hypothetical protein|uniref:Uncharacterized protein n=1 Tax=Neoaquamicrobium microcysteis TaxID=2682781 RepID=A0A5D4GPN8_9HYPH|nr:hypothetical protein [Mesorhizobium microcysteis]TYR30307.1 hypothetical protein FY036_20735 [Mesorhizobium microcysteis]